jgi:peptidyl-dipeptidase A
MQRLSRHAPLLLSSFSVLSTFSLIAACGGASTQVVDARGAGSRWEQEARQLLAFYDPLYVSLATETSRAAWLASTDVSEAHTGQRTGAATAFSAFAGNALFIERARALLTHEDELADLTKRQLRQMLVLAADAPQTNPDLARRRVAAEAHQAETLDGFQFCLARNGATCTQPVITNDLDRILEDSRDLAARERAWSASKEVGVPLRSGLATLQGLRNGVAREMGYDDFFQFQVSNYGMTTAEMMETLDRLVRETRPLYEQLHCYARYELARRYGVAEPPALIPAHWIGNRWGQEWPGLVEGVDMDALLAGKSPEWIVQQAERFYVSLGYPSLPASFWSESDLYPVPAGNPRRKNAHASAWHVDLQQDVRSLMSVEADWRWFTTTHHELGHIYYYLSYTNDDVPPLLREGANRSYHEGMGDLVALAASQEPYLRAIGLLAEGQTLDQQQALLDSALTGPIVFLPWAAGTMSQFEKALYADELPADRFNAKWWELVARYQGLAPPSSRPADACDACTKTHINDDPAQYYDYALANVLVYQLHDHICTNLLHQDPRSCNYAGHPEVGEFLRAIERPGMSRDWRTVLRETVGSDLSAEPMLRYYAPLMETLRARNAGRSCALPAL